MQIVIDIRDEEYNSVMYNNHVPYGVVYAIKNGTPLPKGHGRLIDVKDFYENLSKDKRMTFSRHDIWMMLRPYNGIPTIIRADKEG